MGIRWVARAALLGCLAAGAPVSADETSTGDKLRILYSSQFTFTDGGVPLVTVELIGGESSAKVSATGGVVVQPDGAGGASIEAGDSDAPWTISIENGRPAVVREWTVVARLAPEDEKGADAEQRRWQRRGLRATRFEVGTVFGVEGEVMDTRELLIAVDPVRAPGGERNARSLATRFKVETSVYTELVRRPQGTIVARSGAITVRNPSVLWFQPRHQERTIEVANVLVGAGGSQLSTHREDRRYWGSVYATVGRDGKLTIVNAVAADKLLAGLVPAEMYPDAPMAALEAQAIAARTELMEKLGTRHLADPFLLCSSQQCQVYSGAGREHPRTSKAVEATRGMVLMRDGGGLVDARYSAADGGFSENNETIWGGAPDPSLRGVLDQALQGALAKRFAGGINDANIGAFLALPPEATYCGRSKWSKDRCRWRRRVDAAELSRALAAQAPNLGRVVALEPLSRGISGRINRLAIRGDRGRLVIDGELEIRRLLGGLRSSLFVVELEGPEKRPHGFVLRGGGFGHGVGMSQLGAIGMALDGRGRLDILRHYYRGSRVRRLY